MMEDFKLVVAEKNMFEKGAKKVAPLVKFGHRCKDHGWTIISLKTSPLLEFFRRRRRMKR